MPFTLNIWEGQSTLVIVTYMLSVTSINLFVLPEEEISDLNFLEYYILKPGDLKFTSETAF